MTFVSKTVDNSALDDAEDNATPAQLLEEAHRINPDDPVVLSKLGNVLKRTGRFEEACSIHESLVRAFPNAPEALSDLAATLLSWGKTDEAVDAFQKALSLRPDSADLAYNLAVAEQVADKMEAAVFHYRSAVAHNPNLQFAWSNLGICLKAVGQIEEAVSCQRRAASLAPTNADIQWNLSLTELLTGDLAGGFARYEWRRKIPGYKPVLHNPWDGHAAPDQTLTVIAEQGLGDALQFMRYLPRARARVGKVRFMCRESMLPLLRHGFFGADEIVPMEPIADDVLAAPLMSLPHLTNCAAPLSESVPYLQADPKKVRYWSSLLRMDPSIHVGVVWQGNPSHRDDRHRSISIHALRPLLTLRDARFFSLQKQHGVDDIGRALFGLNIVDLSDALDDEGAFVDTAAVIETMDLVITVDTSVAHLSGALGKETWTLLPFAPDFRWGLKESIFYPTMRLFRQTRRNDWTEVIASVRDALIERCRLQRGDP